MRYLGLVAVCLVLGGCAVGMRDNPDGTQTPVIGISAGGGMPSQDVIVGGASIVGGLIGGPGGAALAGTVATAVLGLFGYGAARNQGKRREAERELARVEGREEGWDQREAAASVQAPLPVVRVPDIGRLASDTPIQDDMSGGQIGDRG